MHSGNNIKFIGSCHSHKGTGNAYNRNFYERDYEKQYII